MYKAKVNAKVWERFDGEALTRDVGYIKTGVVVSGAVHSSARWVLSLSDGRFSRLDQGWWEEVAGIPTQNPGPTPNPVPPTAILPWQVTVTEPGYEPVTVSGVLKPL